MSKTPLEPEAGPPPRRLSTDERSPNFHPDAMKVGVTFNGVERQRDVVEYDADEGWIKSYARDTRGRVKQERGRAVVVRQKGVVEPYWV